MRGNYSSGISHENNNSQSKNNMDTQCVSVTKGSRRLDAVEKIRSEHVKQCEDRILARARIVNGADPRYKNGK